LTEINFYRDPDLLDILGISRDTPMDPYHCDPSELGKPLAERVRMRMESMGLKRNEEAHNIPKPESSRPRGRSRLVIKPHPSRQWPCG